MGLAGDAVRAARKASGCAQKQLSKMKRLNLHLATWLLACVAIASMPVRAADTAPLYESNFEKIAPGAVPDDFLILDGAFAVQQEGSNKFLELPGEPLDTFGVLFGPTVKTNVAVSARV